MLFFSSFSFAIEAPRSIPQAIKCLSGCTRIHITPEMPREWVDSILNADLGRITDFFLQNGSEEDTLTDARVRTILQRCPNLTSLSLFGGGKKFCGAGILDLQALTKLEKVDFTACVGLDKRAVGAIVKVPSITSVNIRSCKQLGANELCALLKPRAITHLNVGGGCGNATPMAKALNLVHSQFSAIIVREGGHLTSLDLTEGAYSDKDILRIVNGCPNLKVLRISQREKEQAEKLLADIQKANPILKVN